MTRRIETQAEQWPARMAAVDISPWAYIRHTPWKGGGLYQVHDKATRREIGQMGYLVEDDGTLYINGIHTHSDPGDDYTHRGVATALLERLHADNPGVKINPGFRTDAGEGLMQHLKQTEPEFDEVAIPHEKDIAKAMRRVRLRPRPAEPAWGEV